MQAPLEVVLVALRLVFKAGSIKGETGSYLRQWHEQMQWAKLCPERL